MINARLIIDDPQPGSWNMAIDQALLESANFRQEITLRWYQWAPPTLSLGYFQSYADRQQHDASLVCDVVRRASGGGAIVHDHEWTYSLSLPAENRLARIHENLVDQVHGAIIDTLRQFEVVAQFFSHVWIDPTDLAHLPDRPHPFLCFLRRTGNDLVIGPHKVCGSAQRRVDGAILQHGSLLMKRSKHAPELPGVVDLAKKQIGIEENPRFVALLTSNIAKSLDLVFEQQPPTDGEIELAKLIEISRFANSHWTCKR